MSFALYWKLKANLQANTIRNLRGEVEDSRKWCRKLQKAGKELHAALLALHQKAGTGEALEDYLVIQDVLERAERLLRLHY